MSQSRHPAFEEIESPDRARREHAVLELERLGTPDALSAILLADFRGEIEHPMAQKLVIDLGSPDAAIRRAAADNLSAFFWNDPATKEAVVPALVKALGDSDRGVRISSAFALGVFGSAAAVDGLLGALDADPDSGMKVVIIKALGTTKSKALLPALRQLADTGPSRCVRVASQKALNRIQGVQY